MGIRSAIADRLDRTASLAATATGAADDRSPRPDTVEPSPRPGAPWPSPIERAIAEQKLALWAGAAAESLPPVRRAVRLIAGTVGAWSLTAWRDGHQLPANAIPWLAQPDPDRTSQVILSPTLHDGIWNDRAVWREVPGGWRRVAASRVVEIPADDVDDPPTVLIDGAAPRDRIMVFRWGGAGGLRALSGPLLSLLGDVFAAAARYAQAPAPEVILKNTGMDISKPQITELLDDWDAGRATHTTGYLGAYLEAVTVGYSAKDLQLIEAMDELTKEVARLFSLPAPALGVSAGDSMTYSTTVEARRDVLEALRPWSTGVEQTMSMSEYVVDIRSTGVTAVRRGRFVPWGTDVRLDSSNFAREAWSTRMDVLGRAIAAVGPDGRPLLTVDEARDLEPTIRAVEGE